MLHLLCPRPPKVMCLSSITSKPCGAEVNCARHLVYPSHTSTQSPAKMRSIVIGRREIRRARITYSPTFRGPSPSLDFMQCSFISRSFAGRSMTFHFFFKARSLHTRSFFESWIIFIYSKLPVCTSSELVYLTVSSS